MPHVISVSGGKGGTGKTTVAVNLSVMLSKNNKKVLLVDADVDAPNVHLLMNAERKLLREVHAFLPVIDNDKCIKCGECAKACRIHALIQAGDSYPVFFPELCTSCGACALVCPTKAISDGQKLMGWIYTGHAFNVDLLMGELKLGESSSATVVTALKEELNSEKYRDYDFIVVDTSPGAHCDVLRAIIGSKFVLAVTEPTPFASHDLRRLIELANTVNIPVKIIVNRSGIVKDNSIIEKVAQETNSEIIATIPYDDLAVKAYAEGKPVVLEYPDSPSSRAILKISKIVEEVLKQ
ncbi:MAG: P-loop NTPase [Candidatus Asgardarchaeia archaeon]